MKAFIGALFLTFRNLVNFNYSQYKATVDVYRCVFMHFMVFCRLFVYRIVVSCVVHNCVGSALLVLTVMGIPEPRSVERVTVQFLRFCFICINVSVRELSACKNAISMKKNLFLSMIAMLMFAFTAVSCSDDESGPDLSGFNDYFISVEVNGGGWDYSDLKKFETSLYIELMEFSEYFEGVRKDDAIEMFDEIVDLFEYEWRNGASDVYEPMYVKFNLETVVEGYVVKTKTVTIKPAKKNAPEERGVILLNK